MKINTPFRIQIKIFLIDHKIFTTQNNTRNNMPLINIVNEFFRKMNPLTLTYHLNLMNICRKPLLKNNIDISNKEKILS